MRVHVSRGGRHACAPIAAREGALHGHNARLLTTRLLAEDVFKGVAEADNVTKGTITYLSACRLRFIILTHNMATLTATDITVDIRMVALSTTTVCRRRTRLTHHKTLVGTITVVEAITVIHRRVQVGLRLTMALDNCFILDLHLSLHRTRRRALLLGLEDAKMVGIVLPRHLYSTWDRQLCIYSKTAVPYNGIFPLRGTTSVPSSLAVCTGDTHSQ